MRWCSKKGIEQMFTYTTEKELHEHIVENFSDYFDFNYVESEHRMELGIIDIVGKDADTIYLIEIKRDFIDNSAIKQLSKYVDLYRKYNPGIKVKGIAVAPRKRGVFSIEDDSISINILENVTLSGKYKRRVTFTVDETLLEELKMVSKESMVPQAKIVTRALEAYLKKNK